jgi:hypothetical protein
MTFLCACACFACGGPSRSPSGGSDSGAGIPLGEYHDVTDPANWSIFDATGVDRNAKAFIGGAFDGRYVYFAPSQGPVARYDVQGDFRSASSWSMFDPTTLDPKIAGFLGVTFDGTYLYFSPNWDPGIEKSLVTRYDTRAPFTAASSWATFDAVTADPKVEAFAGGTFDGRYVYLAPSGARDGAPGIAARHDTQAELSAPASWSTFDTTAVDGQHTSFTGAVFDGRYVYFVPVSSTAALSGLVTRYDARGGFADPASWSTFFPSTVRPGTLAGGAFDGRFVYLVPALGGVVVRYDTQAPFAAESSWSAFDAAQVNANVIGFFGAAFDGRFVYFIPYATIPEAIVRYDTLGTFGASSSWSGFTTTALDPKALGFKGAVFDGRYLYLAPDANGTVARFDARSPAAMPKLPGFTGSFL